MGFKVQKVFSSNPPPPDKPVEKMSGGSDQTPTDWYSKGGTIHLESSSPSLGGGVFRLKSIAQADKGGGEPPPVTNEEKTKKVEDTKKKEEEEEKKREKECEKEKGLTPNCK